MIFILFQELFQAMMPLRNSAAAVAREMRRKGGEALSAFFSLQPRAQWPEWRSKTSLASQSNPLRSLEDRSSCDPILLFKIGPPKYQLKTQPYSNVRAKTKQLYVFTLMRIKCLDKVSHFWRFPGKVTEQTVFYSMLCRPAAASHHKHLQWVHWVWVLWA